MFYFVQRGHFNLAQCTFFSTVLGITLPLCYCEEANRTIPYKKGLSDSGEEDSLVRSKLSKESHLQLGIR